MKLINQHKIINALFLSIAVSVSSCDSILDEDSLPTSGKSIELSFTRGYENSTLEDNSYFRIAFFTGEEYTPFFSTNQLQGINTYTTDAYDTGVPYPSNNVHAVGYAPSDSINLSKDQKTLELKFDNTAGTTDVRASQTITGNSNSHFSKESPMKFEHLLTKVTFYAKRDYTMQYSKLVHDVKVTLGSSYLVKEWKYKNGGSYAAVVNTDSPKNLELHIPNQYLTDIDTEYFIGTCYLNMPTNNEGKLSFGLEAILTPTETTENIQSDYGQLDIQLMEDKDGGQQKVTEAKAGEAYEVVINFTQNSFTLSGVKAPWKAGGLITIPINPTNK